MVVGKQLILIVGAFVLACGAEPDDVIDEGASSEEASNEEALTSPASSAATGDPACRGVTIDMSTPEAAEATYARLRASNCTVQIEVTRRGQQLPIKYSIR